MANVRKLPDWPTFVWLLIVVFFLFVVYHVTIGKKR